MDELALAAEADPVAFRLRHLDDERAKAVVRLAAERFGWGAGKAHGTGHGFAFARYKNLAACCAVAVEVEVVRETGRVRLARAVAAVDAGQVVNPDGLRNQIEGAILQSMSWTLFESVGFDEGAITSVDWATYPILRFDGVPDRVEVHIVDRPGAAVPGQRRGRPGTHRGGDRQRDRRRHRLPAPRPAFHAGEGKGRPGAVTAAASTCAALLPPAHARGNGRCTPPISPLRL